MVTFISSRRSLKTRFTVTSMTFVVPLIAIECGIVVRRFGDMSIPTTWTGEWGTGGILTWQNNAWPRCDLGILNIAMVMWPRFRSWFCLWRRFIQNGSNSGIWISFIIAAVFLLASRRRCSLKGGGLRDASWLYGWHGWESSLRTAVYVDINWLINTSPTSCKLYLRFMNTCNFVQLEQILTTHDYR